MMDCLSSSCPVLDETSPQNDLLVLHESERAEISSSVAIVSEEKAVYLGIAEKDLRYGFVTA